MRDNPKQAANGLKIYFENSKAYDVVGPLGATGRNGVFVINAGEAGVPIEAGKKYRLFTETTNGLGVGPVEVVLSGSGFENVGILDIVPNGGLASIPSPAVQASAVQTEPTPNIKIFFGDRVYQDQGKDFAISKKPKVKMEVTIDPPYSLDQKSSAYTLLIDDQTYSFTSTRIEKNKAELEATLSNALAAGNHIFKFSAASAGDQGGASVAEQTAKVLVSAGTLRTLDVPICYPNPFNPEKDKNVTFQYTLSDDAKIEIFIFSVAGEVVKKMVLREGQEGAIGQLNKVKWDGMTDQGMIVSSGMYLVNIVSPDESRVNNKIKLSVYR